VKRTVLVLFEITWDDSAPGNWTSECTLDGDVQDLYRTRTGGDIGTDLVHQFAWAMGNMAALKRWEPFPARRADS
jgi:hypothetical protein